jgi:peptidoglycan/LPS O-acetylase OafA/YrhL
MERFTLIDSLRGIAALMVVVVHLSLPVEAVLSDKLPAFINTLIKSGHFGVEIFFVISGFVIAHSIRNGNWSVRYLTQFALRRSIRLDPPYWAIISLEVMLIYLSLHFFPDLGTDIPNIKQIAAHLIYMQELLGLGNLLPIFWTLAYEVQFYLVLVGSLVVYAAIKNHSKKDSKLAFIIFVIISSFAYLTSLAIFLHYLPPSIHGLFIDRWYQFFLGALTWWCTYNRHAPRLYFLVWSFTLLASLFALDTAFERASSTLMVLSVCLLVYAAAVSDNLTRWLSSPKLLFMGTISYSLYLVHLPIGWRLIALEQKLIGDHNSLLIAVLELASGILISILAAWLLHIWIERPSLNFTRRVRLPKVQRKHLKSAAAIDEK